MRCDIMLFGKFDKIFLIVLAVLVLAIFVSGALVLSPGGIVPDDFAFHPLKFVTMGDGSMTSVDADEDGVIDAAETINKVCAEGKILKYISGVWECRDDTGGTGGTASCSTTNISFGPLSFDYGAVLDIPSECIDGPCVLTLSVTENSNNWAYGAVYYPGEATTGDRYWSSSFDFDAPKRGIIANGSWKSIIGSPNYVLIGDDCPTCSTGVQNSETQWTAWSYKANQSAKLISCSLGAGGTTTGSGLPSCTNPGEIAKFNGTTWACADDETGGTGDGCRLEKTDWIDVPDTYCEGARCSDVYQQQSNKICKMLGDDVGKNYLFATEDKVRLDETSMDNLACKA